MSDHVAKSPTPSMLCEGVLMLTLGNTQMVLNVQVSKKFLKVVGGRFTRSVRIEDAKALRTLALVQAGRIFWTERSASMRGCADR